MIIFLFIMLVIILTCGAFYAYRIAYYSPKQNRNKIPTFIGHQYDPHRIEIKRLYSNLNNQPYEYVTIQSHDGLILSGRYYHIQDGAPLDIGFHGYRSSPLTDFSGGSELSFQIVHNLLLVDQRGHGRSQGKTITFGILERRDLLRWVEYAVDRFGCDTKIILYGISMGGATVLMAAELNLPENVKGIVADCPYSSPIDIMLHVSQKMPIPTVLVKPFIYLGAWLFGHFHVGETTAANAVKHTQVPILIIHGECDCFVPAKMSEEVYAANPKMIRRFTFPGADHGISYLVDRERYCNIVKNFIHEVLS